MKKETSKQESYISYLLGVQEGIRLATEVFKSDKTPSLVELMDKFKERSDKANERLEMKPEEAPRAKY